VIIVNKTELEYIDLNNSCIIFIETSKLVNKGKSNYVISLVSVAYNENNKVVLIQFLNDSLETDKELLQLLIKELNKHQQVSVINSFFSEYLIIRFKANNIDYAKISFCFLGTTVKEIYSTTNIPIYKIAKESPDVYMQYLYKKDDSVLYEYLNYNKMHTILLIEHLKQER
jgi:uncharacterized protein YprB with RNaseH-like and TPR domain